MENTTPRIRKNRLTPIVEPRLFGLKAICLPEVVVVNPSKDHHVFQFLHEKGWPNRPEDVAGSHLQWQKEPVAFLHSFHHLPNLLRWVSSSPANLASSCSFDEEQSTTKFGSTFFLYINLE
jgi:hypothetical protein